MIQTRLAGRFQLSRVRQVGSHWKGTAIKLYSDLDLLAIMSRDEARKWAHDGGSSTLIGRVRGDLQQRYQLTTVRRDGQAVVVNFGGGEHSVDVVPAVFGKLGQTLSYLIPDGNGGWLETFPDAERKYLLERDLRSGKKLLRLVRLMKWWSFARSTTSGVKSRYLENFLSRCGLQVAMTYPEALAHAFLSLSRWRCKGLDDPIALTNETTRVAATQQQSEAIRDAVERSAERAAEALAADAAGKWQQAVHQWALVFNHQFPT
jgi:Second Messenger Oligonucleotide or Dinucleotide Synthetase domain